MSKIIDLDMEKIKRDPETIKLKNLSDSIDLMVLDAVSSGSDPAAIAAVILNRFKAVAEMASAKKGYDVADLLKKRFL